MIGRDSFQPADRDRFFVDASASARRLTGPVTDAAEYPGEHVRLTILDIRVAKTALRNEPYI
jgi:hypothetical protein